MAKRQRTTGPTFIGRSREVASEQKAIWHNVIGAGRRGVIRRFFDLNEQDTDALKEGLGKLMAARLGVAE